MPPDEPVFTEAHREALRDMQRLIDLGVMPEEDQQALIRSVGRSFARLADWQMGVLGSVVDPESTTLEQLAQVMEELTPTVERLQQYVWRRHTLLAASRLLLAADRGQPEASTGPDDAAAPDSSEAGAPLGVGFADIVGYTRTSRSLSRRELTRFVDYFEGRALEIATSHGGRIIKTIGDEVLFVADTPVELARIGLALVEERQQEGPDGEEFPELRVGLAWGETVARLGDVLGPVVNIASRLTSTARAGSVLVDRALAESLQEREELRLRRVRRVSVKGYRRLEPYVLRRGGAEDPEEHASVAEGSEEAGA